MKKVSKVLDRVNERAGRLKLGRLFLSGVVWIFWAPAWLLGRLARGVIITATWIVAVAQDGFISGSKRDQEGR